MKSMRSGMSYLTSYLSFILRLRSSFSLSVLIGGGLGKGVLFSANLSSSFLRACNLGAPVRNTTLVIPKMKVLYFKKRSDSTILLGVSRLTYPILTNLSAAFCTLLSLFDKTSSNKYSSTVGKTLFKYLKIESTLTT